MDNDCNEYEEQLRESVRKDFGSELGKQQLKYLNSSLKNMIDDFVSGKDVNRLDLFDHWTKPAKEHCESELQIYFNDEYLKEIGLYEAAVAAREDDEENLKADVAYQAERDRNHFLERYEDKNSSYRRSCLNFDFHKAIREYLYNNGECPKYMDCFDAEIEVLRNYGIVHHVLNQRAIREEEKYRELLEIADSL
jgi:hypothetical protein